MIVVTAIIGILSIIVFVGQADFSRSLLLANTASDIALSLRNAQVYGIGSRSTGGVRNAGYGLYFASANPASFIFFADTDPAPSMTSCHPTNKPNSPAAQPGDCAYTSALDTLVQTFTLNNGMKIDNFCVYENTGAKYCVSEGPSLLTQMAIVFTRPNTSALIRAGTGGWFGGVWQNACIRVASPQGTTRSILVTQTGAITKTASCP